MAKYKVRDSYKSAENKHFGIHKQIQLLAGNYIEITNFNELPESVQGHLELEKTKTKVSKKDTKKQKEINNGSSN